MSFSYQNTNRYHFLLILILLYGCFDTVYGQDNNKMMIIIIDGARYSETFGDPDFTYTPEMWELAQEGTIIDNFYNDGITYTSSAIPALWCGTWTDVRDTVYDGNSTSYAVKPTLFEYYRKQKNMSSDKCYYILKYINSLWLPSFDPDYGPDFWPEFQSYGESDDDVAEQTVYIMDTYHPNFMWVYLADVDHGGHSGSWSEYTNAIQNADQIVGDLWNKIQSDPFYANSTTLFVTNDHGRHDDQHGGFTGHGCSCEGCRHIQFLAIGPHIKQGAISTQNRYIPDMAVTASHLLGINPDKATGNIMHEILNLNSIDENHQDNPLLTLQGNYPNPFQYNTHIKYELAEKEYIIISIYDFMGHKIKILEEGFQQAGEHEAVWDGTDEVGNKAPSGFYLYTIQVNSITQKGKLYLIRNN